MARRETTHFGGGSFAFRFILAVVAVFGSYNPEGYSYYHWALAPLVGTAEGSDFSVFKALVGVVLLIGWAVLIRATSRSLGAIGLILATLFFGLLIWLLVDLGGLDTGSFRVIAYLVQAVLIGVLSIGVSWSHIRRRITGQVDVDDVED